MIRWEAIRCRLGAAMMAVRDNRGVCWLSFADTLNDFGQHQQWLSQLFPETESGAARLYRDPGLRPDLEAILDAAEAGKSPPELPLDLLGTPFQMQVWSALGKIAAGTTQSYAAVARELGQPEAVRAVARACARNRVALLIPCHRVIGADGRLRGYRWGIHRKQQLLDWEQQKVSVEML